MTPTKKRYRLHQNHVQSAKLRYQQKNTSYKTALFAILRHIISILRSNCKSDQRYLFGMNSLHVLCAIVLGLFPATFGYYGDGTWYNLGLTACGQSYSNSDYVCAIASSRFTSPNPNNDPLCNRKIRIQDPSSGKTVDVKCVDKCEGCQYTDIDMSPAAFKKLRSLDVGRFKVNWWWIWYIVSRSWNMYVYYWKFSILPCFSDNNILVCIFTIWFHFCERIEIFHLTRTNDKTLQLHKCAVKKSSLPDHFVPKLYSNTLILIFITYYTFH